MTVKRYIGICVVALLVSEILTGTIHGFVLAQDYAPFYGTLLRAQSSGTWQYALLPVAHLSFVAALVWLYTRIAVPGRWLVSGIRLGLLGWLIGTAPLWLIWYAEQPWPGTLLLKQLPLELASTIVVALVIAAMAPRS